jgi:hypothetical protein
MKCVGIAGYPLPSGEGFKFLHSTLCLPGDRGAGGEGVEKSGKAF